MKTELMLLLQTDGRPVMNLAQCAELLNIQTNSFLNRIYAETVPFPMFQLEGSREWYAHISDVAAYIDKQRAAATKALEDAPAGGGQSSRRHTRRGQRAGAHDE